MFATYSNHEIVIAHAVFLKNNKIFIVKHFRERKHFRMLMMQ